MTSWDEQNQGLRTRTRVWDVRDLDAPEVAGVFDNSTTSIDHNLYTENGVSYHSNYTSGLRIYDNSRLARGQLSQVAYFDLYPENDNATFEGGTWSNYPYYRGERFVAVGSPTPTAACSCWSRTRREQVGDQQDGAALTDDTVSAHGIGGASDLPIPLSFVVVGAGCALAVSFAVLAFSWQTSRLTGDRAGRPLPTWVGRVVDSPWLRAASSAASGWSSPRTPAGLPWRARTPPPTRRWASSTSSSGSAGLVVASSSGNIWPLLSPMRTLHLGLSRLLNTPPDRGLLTYPSWLGYWPAAFGLFAFVWTELVSPDAEYVSTVITWCLLYAAVMLVGSAVFGSSFLAYADPFEAWFGLVAKLSPWGRAANPDGRRRVVFRSPLNSLDTVVPERGLVALVSVLLGSTAYDSFSTSSWWVQRTARLGALDPTLRDSLILFGFVALVAVTFSVASVLGAGLPRSERRRLPRLMAHSLVPVGVGYVFAHYLTLLLETGQAYVIFLSDPLVTGEADYLGTADWTVTYFLSVRPELLAGLKVVFVLTGHVLGVVAAHDRAVRVLPARSAVSGQLAMLTVMVGYTVGGLLLLFSV